MPPRFDSLLSSSRELNTLTNKARQLMALQTHWAQIAPPSLLRSSRVLRLDGQLLTIAADSGAVAAKLRQLTHELATRLQERGCEVTGIQIQVQVSTSPPTHSKQARKISASSQLQLSEFCLSLPDSPLKIALERLSKNK